MAIPDLGDLAHHFDHRAEAALLRTLADIHDGHIGLYAEVWRYDPITGQPLAEPATHVNPDRTPAYGTPNQMGEWWQPLIDRGWLELVESGRSHYRVSAKGVEALAEFNR